MTKQRQTLFSRIKYYSKEQWPNITAVKVKVSCQRKKNIPSVQCSPKKVTQRAAGISVLGTKMTADLIVNSPEQSGAFH